MDKDHDKIVQNIQKRMAGASMLKSQQQKKNQIFQYGENEVQHQNLIESQKNAYFNQKPMMTVSQVEKSLEEIYNFYVNTYIQPRKNIQSFDMVNQRRLTFQPFILFMKNFKLFKTIFSLEKIKLVFKKYANFGQYLTLQNFIFLINQIAHHSQARSYFKVQQITQNNELDLEIIQQIQKQQLYSYLRANFKNMFQPFFCKQKIKDRKINFTYRKFSQPELLKKSFPQNRNKTEEKQLYVVKHKDVHFQQNVNPFNQAKSIVVSWQSLKSHSLANLQRNSEDIIKKKYLKDDPNNDQYLREYQSKQNQQRMRLQKKIKQLTHQQQSKNKMILSKLQKKTTKPLILDKKLIK